jgi:hypothetical protein
VSVYLHDVDSSNREDWPRQHAWFAQRLNAMHRAFAPLVRELDADDWGPEEA